METGERLRYGERLAERVKASGSRLCVGLDPRPGERGATGVLDWLRQVVGETAEHAAAFKPNMAYFEALGVAGIRVLEELLEWMPHEVPVILDAKRSDIGETQRYYAQGYFGRWKVDAVTLNPFLGYDSLEPFLDWAGKGIYLLAVTSNPGSADLQRQTLLDGRAVFELVAAMGQRAREEQRAADVGYVVGLTNAAGVLERMPDAPLLIPGLGAQGGDLVAWAAAGRSAPDVVNVSRGILYGDDGKSYSERAAWWAARIRSAERGGEG
jgi:orotidine-5'-phosphate decarboxylase